MSALDVSGAAARLLANSSVTPGHCLMYVSRAIRNGASPLIWVGLDTAYNCWLHACGNKSSSRDVPAGFPAFLGPRQGSPAGDVMISLGDGRFAATDYPRNGVVGVCTLAQREKQTGRRYLGYAREFLGYTLTNGSTAGGGITPIIEKKGARHMYRAALTGTKRVAYFDSISFRETVEGSADDVAWGRFVGKPGLTVTQGEWNSYEAGAAANAAKLRGGTGMYRAVLEGTNRVAYFDSSTFFETTDGSPTDNAWGRFVGKPGLTVTQAEWDAYEDAANVTTGPGVAPGRFTFTGTATPAS